MTDRAKKRILLWFRNDLRVHDNALLASLPAGAEAIPVYIFNPVQYRKTTYGFPKTGAFRKPFIEQGVTALKENLKKMGSSLIIQSGNPAEILSNIAGRTNADTLFFTKEHTAEELLEEDQVRKALPGLHIQSFEQRSLIHPSDLPFMLSQLPDVFTPFRKEAEKNLKIRQPLPVPYILPPLPAELQNYPDDYSALGEVEYSMTDDRGVMTFHGSEEAGLKRLNRYFFETKAIATYKKTRNGLLGADYSSKFSPWLATGALSPRLIYSELKRFEQEHGANESTYWLLFELLWRDYFRFVAMKYGSLIFQRQGIRGSGANLNINRKAFDLWAGAKTGEPFIDANMTELNTTGFMSNRGRQNAASYLINNLKGDWLAGAAYFESMLIDYDPCSNWGNWMYLAGVGNDPRENRVFNTARQVSMYDPQGKYISHWLGD
ncbi:MAG: DASH family cryptochrome [Ignavibacteriales bacterium]|nr:MAG: DASH family cryptochrome [Ignavibacteriales bacterium]